MRGFLLRRWDGLLSLQCMHVTSACGTCMLRSHCPCRLRACVAGFAYLAVVACVVLDSTSVLHLCVRMCCIEKLVFQFNPPLALASVLCDRNLASHAAVLLKLHLPPLVCGSPAHAFPIYLYNCILTMPRELLFPIWFFSFCFMEDPSSSERGLKSDAQSSVYSDLLHMSHTRPRLLYGTSPAHMHRPRTCLATLRLYTQSNLSMFSLFLPSSFFQ